MDKGFFHPNRGYWQTLGEPPAHILAAYPAGTVEVPLKPGVDYDWDGAEWVHNPPPEPAATEQSLTRPQFEYLLALTGLEDVWDAVEAATKDADRPLYASLRRERVRTTFRYDVTMQFIGQVAAHVPEGVDISPAAIAAAWEAALAVS